MSLESREFRENKHILYKRHNYDLSAKTKNIHHIIFRSEGGTDDIENLALLDRDFHNWIHNLIQKMDNIAMEELIETIKYDLSKLK